MIVLIVLAYLGAVYAAFRFFRIPLAPLSISVAILIGVGVVGSILVSWQGGAPVSQQTTLTRPVLDLAVQLKGQITKINFPIGASVKEGETVFEIDPEPYEAALAQAEAQLEAARAQVSLAEAGIKVAKANIDGAEADAALARTEKERGDRLAAQGSSAISELEVERRRFAFEAASAVVTQTQAAQLQAQASLEATRRNVTAAEETVRNARFNLDITTWEAPADGVMINWFARENTLTSSLRSASIGTFMESGGSRVVAVLPQNLMRNVVVSDPAEVAFMSRPGTIDPGKVVRIANYTGEGQFGVSPNVPRVADIGSKGQIAAVIELDDQELARTLSLGEASVVAVYTQPPGPFHVVSRIYLRMLSLMYFVP